jgi:hypothetical protein
LRLPHCYPSPNFSVWGNPLKSFGSLSEYHPCTTASIFALPKHDVVLAPSEVLFPFSVFPALRSHIVPEPSTALVMFRPQSFSPSRRFAPRMTSQAYFILVPLMGFSLRGLYPHMMPYVLANAGSLSEFNLPDYSNMPLLQGFITSREARPQVWGLTRLLCRLPPWALSTPRFLAPCSQRPFYGYAVPSRASPVWSQADRSVDASGSLLQGTQSLSLETDATPLRFLTSLSPQQFRTSAELGYGLPSKAVPMSP